MLYINYRDKLYLEVGVNFHNLSHNKLAWYAYDK